MAVVGDNFRGGRHWGTALVLAALTMLLLPAQSHASCRSWEKSISFSDGVKACVKDGPKFISRKGLLGPDSRSYLDVISSESSAAFAVSRTPENCPAAYGIAWDWADNGAEALKFCNDRLRTSNASPACQCEVVFDYDRSPLSSDEYTRRLELLERQLLAGGAPLGIQTQLANVPQLTSPPEVLNPIQAANSATPPPQGEAVKPSAPAVPQSAQAAPAHRSDSKEVELALAQVTEKLKVLETQLAQTQAKPSIVQPLNEMISPPKPAPSLEKQKTLRARALVIGNSAYSPKVGALANPINDAQAIADRMIEMGIPTELVLDADRARLGQALARFQRTALDVAILYYAGHGITVNGENFIIPVDFSGSTAAEVELNAISINRQLNHLPGTTRLVFLDACRNPPATVNLASRSLAKGLSAMNVSDGTLISYATKEGSVADDGDGKHSPYTAALLKHINDPDDIAIVLRRVRARVIEATGGRQQPWDYGSLGEGTIVLPNLAPRRP